MDLNNTEKALIKNLRMQNLLATPDRPFIAGQIMPTGSVVFEVKDSFVLLFCGEDGYIIDKWMKTTDDGYLLRGFGRGFRTYEEMQSEWSKL